MPFLRGIDFCIKTHSMTRVLPEFPHPDGSSVRLVGLHQLQRGFGPAGSRCKGQPNSTEKDAGVLHKANPTVSVYVPSLPGEQFFLRYTVVDAPHSAVHLYFKMYMNGRHITSWGTTKPLEYETGIISQAFYEPSEGWQYAEDGVNFKPQGIERRYFYFTAGPNKSVAEDGGLIEVKVFRAHKQRRRAPDLEPYRSQEKYGIASPSGGLLDNPQDQRFCTFSLLDQLESPFATFRFHYRSWNNLVQFNLIPSESSLSRYASSITESESSMTVSQGTSSRLSDGDDISPICKAAGFDFDLKSLDCTTLGSGESVGELVEAISEAKATKACSFNYTDGLGATPELRPSRRSEVDVPEPSKVIRDGFSSSYLQRPLPDLPLQPGFDEDQLTRARSPSSASRAPSITPSLLQYLEDDSSSSSEDPFEIGVAKLVTVPESSSKASLMVDKQCTSRVSEGSSSDYETSPPSTENSLWSSPRRPSPQNYEVTTGSTLEHNLTYFSLPVPRLSPATVSPKAAKILGRTGFSDLDLPNQGTISLTESQWMKSTHSPMQRRFGFNVTNIGKQLHPEKKPGLGLFGGFRKHRLRPGSVDFVGAHRAARLISSPLQISSEVKERVGNWI